jgi:hypothetical protein
MSLKNSNDIIGNQTRDLPACSAVPQPTALPRNPSAISTKRKNTLCGQNVECFNVKFGGTYTNQFAKMR